MIKKKLIAIDLDGTLLTSDYKITDYSLDVLSRLSEMGHAIVLASGRPLRNIIPYYHHLGLKTPLIAYNGLLTLNPSDPSFPKTERRISKDLLKDIADKYEDRLTNYLFESDDSSLYLKKDEPILNPFFPYDDSNRKSLEEVLSKDPYIAVFEADKGLEDILEKEIEAVKPYRYRRWNKMPYSEIYIDGQDKGAALIDLAKYMGISSDDVIAFGDGDNDDSMISFAKLGYAIKGAKSEMLKEKHPLTLDDNDHDGVAKTLEAMLLK